MTEPFTNRPASQRRAPWYRPTIIRLDPRQADAGPNPINAEGAFAKGS